MLFLLLCFNNCDWLPQSKITQKIQSNHQNKLRFADTRFLVFLWVHLGCLLQSFDWSKSSIWRATQQIKMTAHLFLFFFFGCPGFPGSAPSSPPPSSSSSSSSSPSPSSSSPSSPPPVVSGSLPGGASYCSLKQSFPCDRNEKESMVNFGKKRYLKVHCLFSFFPFL